MQLLRKDVSALFTLTLLIALVACQSAAPSEVSLDVGSQLQPAATAQQSTALVWGRVPYCNCLADAATVNVAHALEEANLGASVKEQSPRDGWLYFAVMFDPDSMTADQVATAMIAGGAEVVPHVDTP
ncbi:MAG: hypothetical protein KDE19_05850 [Caldilineaceae bacterium]|nr:hypothetical protein [Caldilineaceae bacterium]